MTVGNDTLYFTYGVLGPTTVTWNGETYYFALNGQGDVTGIFDEDGTLVVIYNWDNAWGYNPIPEGTLASTLGTLNPLRYRSYVYDEETGLYYLQSRYYDPQIGRFINADTVFDIDAGVQGYNIFLYCANNPVNRIDISGADSAEVENLDITDDQISNREGGSTGSRGGWGSFMSAMRSAADGLSMASGQRVTYYSERHHILSNKNKTYTPQYKEIADKYNFSLDSQENIISLNGHKGRHTKAYHELMLHGLHQLDSIARGNSIVFLDGLG